MKRIIKKLKNNTSAFTLIELLAVIVIIGLLAVLIIPKAKRSIDDSKKNTSLISAQSLLRTSTNYYLEKKAQNTTFTECVYDFSNNTNTCEGLEFTGEKPTSGNLAISKKGNISGTITFSKKYDFCIMNEEVKEGKC